MFNSNRKFTFENYGGTIQLRLRRAEDLDAVDTLGDQFWMATSAPLHQLRCDPVLLARLDSDGNRRIKSDDIRAVKKWLFHRLRDLEGVSRKHKYLTLAALDDENTEGRELLTTARRILQNLGEAASPTLSLDQVRNRKAILAQGDHNGDGIIPPVSICDEDLRAFCKDIVKTMGAVDDVNGQPGVSGETLDAFLENAKRLVEWKQQAHENASGDGDELFPLGDATAQGHEHLAAIRKPLEKFYALCRLEKLNQTLERKSAAVECSAEVLTDSSARKKYMTDAPLHRPHTEETLPLDDGLNPQWKDKIEIFINDVAQPLLGNTFKCDTLTVEQWRVICVAFQPYEAWLEAKSGGDVETLGPEKLEKYLKSDMPIRLRAMIDADLQAGPELCELEDLEHIILLQRWFIDVCNNFVSFPDLYNPERRAMFEAGRLIIDGRVLTFNVKVRDPNVHAKTAAKSGTFLLYSEVTGGENDESFYMVTPVTAGRIGNLAVGKRGVLFDRRDRQWDVCVVKIVDNPVSLTEAILAPFRRLWGIVSSTTEKLTSSAEDQLKSQITKTAGKVEEGVKETIATPVAPPPEAPSVPSRSGNLMLTGGVTIAALGSSFAFITKTIANINPWYWLVALALGAIIVIIPTVVVAFFKLRARNLSDILEASGWAINDEMRLTGRLGRVFSPPSNHPAGENILTADLSRLFLRENKRKKRRRK